MNEAKTIRNFTIKSVLDDDAEMNRLVLPDWEMFNIEYTTIDELRKELSPEIFNHLEHHGYAMFGELQWFNTEFDGYEDISYNLRAPYMNKLIRKRKIEELIND